MLKHNRLSLRQLPFALFLPAFLTTFFFGFDDAAHIDAAAAAASTAGSP